MPPLPHGSEWIAVALAYLLGAVPCGWLLARVVKGVDIRTVGSGNIGATNAMRVLGKPLGIVAFLGDFAKGAVPVAVFADAFAAGPLEGGAGAWLPVYCGALAVAGHVWPIYLGFQGGKAVATGCGAIVGIDPLIFVIAGLVWLGVLATTRFVGLASMAMGVAFPVAAWWRSEGQPYGTEVVLGTSALALLILVRHRSNLVRMVAGQEPRIGAKRG